MAYQPDWKTNTATEELVRIYQVAKNKIISDLTAVDVSDYKESEAIKAMNKIQGALAELNAKARRWATVQIPRSYDFGKSITRVKLEILGARPSKRFDRQTHDRSKGEYFELIMKDLNRANATIKRTADTIIHLARTSSRTIDILPETAPVQAWINEDYLQEVFKNWATKGVQEQYTRVWLSKLIKGRLLENMKGGQFIVVNGRHFTIDYYAEMVARTRMREAQTEAAKNMSQEYGNDLVVVSHHANPCLEICKAFEDQIYSISGTDAEYPALTEETTPPFHPNCILSGTKLISPGGFIAGLKANYTGPAVELITADGTEISVTANHMFLTPHGFAPAYLLSQGDDIFYCPDFKRIIAGYPYNNGTPSLIENIISALAESKGMTRGCVPVSPENIHGDGRFCNGDINVIRADRLLRNTNESLFFKHGKTASFDPRNPDAPLFSGESNFASMLKTLAFAADGIMGSLRMPNPFFFTQSRSLNFLNFGIGSEFDAAFEKSAANYQPMNIKFFSDFAHKQSGFIKTDKIIKIKIFPFHGLIYDVQTSTSLYLANGILSSNCEHSISPTSRTAMRISEKYA